MSEIKPLAPAPQVPVPTGPILETAIKASIHLGDTAQIAGFGEQAQREVAGFADQILQQARGRDLGDTGALLSELMAKAKGLDVADLRKADPITRLIGGVRRQVSRFRSQFETVASQIDAISTELQTRVDRMRHDMQMLDGLHAQARCSISALDGFIAAGKAFADEFRRGELVALQAGAAEPAADGGHDLLAAQAYQDAMQALDRLEKRVYTLQQARQIAVQQLPQIRVVQNGDATLVESLSASITLTIPAWKQKMVLLLGLERQREALAMQKAVTDTTNALIRRTSEMLKTQALEIERHSQEGVVDLGLLARTNEELIETITGVLNIQAEGRQNRATAETEMKRQTEQLRLTLAIQAPTQRAA